MLAFDIGGTWFRSAMLEAGFRVSQVTRLPAISVFGADSLSPSEAKASLVDYLVSTARASLADHCPRIAAISLGAAYNAKDEIVLGAAPLWGADETRFRLGDILKQKCPDVSWHITNDVTAMALRAARLPSLQGRTFALITLSTGIAARLVAQPGTVVPIDNVTGVQGEIGHLPATVILGDQRLHAPCDCGAMDHLASFLSGRGLARCLAHPVIASFLTDAGLDERAGSPARWDYFGEALQGNAGWAQRVLSALAAPLADLMATWITFDPRITAFALTGGLFDNVRDPLLRALVRHSRDHGPYLIAKLDPDWLAKRLMAIPDDDVGGLIGAGIFADRQRAGEEIYA